VSNNFAETAVASESQEIVDKPAVRSKGGIDSETVVNNATILSDPDMDADLLEYLMMDWTKEFKEAVWQLLGEETKARLDEMQETIRNERMVKHHS